MPYSEIEAKKIEDICGIISNAKYNANQIRSKISEIRDIITTPATTRYEEFTEGGVRSTRPVHVPAVMGPAKDKYDRVITDDDKNFRHEMNKTQLTELLEVLQNLSIE